MSSPIKRKSSKHPVPSLPNDPFVRFMPANNNKPVDHPRSRNEPHLAIQRPPTVSASTSLTLSTIPDSIFGVRQPSPAPADRAVPSSVLNRPSSSSIARAQGNNTINPAANTQLPPQPLWSSGRLRPVSKRSAQLSTSAAASRHPPSVNPAQNTRITKNLSFDQHEQLRLHVLTLSCSLLLHQSGYAMTVKGLKKTGRQFEKRLRGATAQVVRRFDSYPQMDPSVMPVIAEALEACTKQNIASIEKQVEELRDRSIVFTREIQNQLAGLTMAFGECGPTAALGNSPVSVLPSSSALPPPPPRLEPVEPLSTTLLEDMESRRSLIRPVSENLRMDDDIPRNHLTGIPLPPPPLAYSNNGASQQNQ